MKSRILSCFLIFALCFSMLSACGSDTAPSDHSPSSSLHTEISDSQDSTPGEAEERDGFESLDSDSCKGNTVPSQLDAPSASQGQQTESSAPTEITTASSFSLSDVPAYSGKAYTSVNGNVPYFSAAELTTTSFETYSDLDMIGISKRLLLIPVQHPKYSVRNPSEPLATYILTMRMSLKSSGNIAAAELSIRRPKSSTCAFLSMASRETRAAKKTAIRLFCEEGSLWNML